MPHLALQCIQHLDSFRPVASFAVHVDEDIVGHQVGGAPLSEQLAVHIDRQIQLIGLPEVGVISAGAVAQAANSGENLRSHPGFLGLYWCSTLYYICTPRVVHLHCFPLNHPMNHNCSRWV